MPAHRLWMKSGASGRAENLKHSRKSAVNISCKFQDGERACKNTNQAGEQNAAR